MGKQYKTSIVIIAIMVAAGIIMQFMFGGFNVRLLAFPVNVIVLALIVLAVTGFTLYREKGAFRLLSGIPFSVSVITALLLCCIVMGFIPQHEHSHTALGLLVSVTSSWPFIFIYLALILSLGCVIARALVNFTVYRWSFYMNHIGLWLVFTGAGFGSADYRELMVKIPEGETVTHGIGGMMPVELPYTVRLDRFTMEEYPVRWGLVDIRTNRFQPEKKPVYYQTEEEAFTANPSPGIHERIASTRPEPKSYKSDLTVTFPDGTEKQTAIMVNRPYRHRSWTLYQSGYDREAGPDSSYSIFKAVKDPWLPLVYSGILMLAVGALSMLTARNKKRKK